MIVIKIMVRRTHQQEADHDHGHDVARLGHQVPVQDAVVTRHLGEGDEAGEGGTPSDVRGEGLTAALHALQASQKQGVRRARTFRHSS